MTTSISGHTHDGYPVSGAATGSAKWFANGWKRLVKLQIAAQNSFDPKVGLRFIHAADKLLPRWLRDEMQPNIGADASSLRDSVRPLVGPDSPTTGKIQNGSLS